MRSLIDRSLARLTGWRDQAAVRQSFRHIAGPAKFILGDHDVAVVLIGMDVAFYLERFFAHHAALGARHFIYIDNGSADASVEIACRFENTIVASCSASFRDFEGLIRGHAVSHFAVGGWRLVVDADELFDYPGASRLALPDLTRALSANGHTAVVAQMLDMVPPGPLTQTLAASYDSAIAACNSYHLGDITDLDYHSRDIDWNYFLARNSVANPAIKIKFGGIRHRLFGENCCLTKHPLFRPGPGVLPLPHPHVSTGLRCADFTALLRHYKFSGNYLDREAQRLNRNLVAHDESAQRMARFAAEPQVSFLLPGARFDPTPEGLLDAGFLVASDASQRMFAP